MIPQPPDRNPFEFAFFLMVSVSIWKSALGFQELPPSIAKAPVELGRGSAIVLLIGCILVIVGLMLPNRNRGLTFEQLGCGFAFFGLLFYGVALGVNSDLANAAYAMGFSFGGAVGALVREVQIQIYFRRRRKITEALSKLAE